MTEPAATALLLSIFGLLMAASVFFTRTLDRFGVPVVLLFLVLGMLGGSEAIGGVHFDNHSFAFRVGTIALVLILFDGGLNTRWSAIRRSAAPAGVLATVGVVGTAGLLACIARLLGLPWPEALLIGAIVSSTDAAAVFAVLRGGSIRIKERARGILEVESCINDPMAVILTVTVIQAFSAGAFSPWTIVWQVPLQLLVGAAAGVAVGYLMRWLLARASFRAVGLYPVATLASAFIAFGAMQRTKKAALSASSGMSARTTPTNCRPTVPPPPRRCKGLVRSRRRADILPFGDAKGAVAAVGRVGDEPLGIVAPSSSPTV
ncbi:MAG: cation:proton antiporter, partial [Planctomycetota bacterium]|nr:cation:proton antiporter [Planctomycetota bacterium]